MSPVWELTKWRRATGSITASSPPGNRKHIAFVGVAHPELLIAAIQSKSLEPVVQRIWTTLGAFNVIIEFSSNLRREMVLRFLASLKEYCWELWTVKGDKVQLRTLSPRTNGSRSWNAPLRAILKDVSDPQLRNVSQEYAALAASAISRGQEVMPRLAETVISQTMPILAGLGEFKSGEAKHEAVLSDMTHLNAALSRFSSQAFSGTSPIVATECHYWIHSLLGTGLANLAIHNIVDYIHSVLGAERIPEKFSQYDQVTRDFPRFDVVEPRDERNFTDYLSQIELPDPSISEPVHPLVTYFSGRDGFQSHLQTLSVPLSSISACNAHPGTLLTLTHEISHVEIQQVLNSLLFNLEDAKERSEALRYWGSPFEPTDLLSAARMAFYSVFVALDQTPSAVGEKTERSRSVEKVKEAIAKHISEVTEILVHVFDFAYFYGQDIDKYVRGIWVSWSAIPDISSRIEEYLVRTCCAIFLSHMRREKPIQASLNDVERVLGELNHRQPANKFIEEALGFVKAHRSQLMTSIAARLPLARIVRTLCFSQRVAAKLLGEEVVSGGGREGYAHVYPFLRKRRIQNPLKFVEVYTEGTAPSESRSIWMLSTIALNHP